MNDLAEMLGTLRDLAVLMQPQGPSPTGGVAGLDWRVMIVDGTGAPASIGGGTQYADGATQANPTGNVVLWLDTANAIRAASAAKPLPVNVVAGSGSGVSVVDAAGWTTASSVFVPGGGVFNDSAAALTAGQQGTGRLTAQRAGHVNLRTTAGADMGLTNNGAAPGALTNLGVLPVLANAAAPSWTEGRQVLLSTDLTGTLRIGGQVASGAALGGNPVLQGFSALAHGANPTAVAAGQAVSGLANRAGVPFMMGGHPNVQTVTANFTAAQTDFALVTVATGLKIVVTSLLVTASFANTVNVSVVIGFGPANTPTLTANTAIAAVVGGHPNIAPGSGFGRGGGSGILGVGADDADLRITNSVPTGGSINCTVSYFTVES